MCYNADTESKQSTGDDANNHPNVLFCTYLSLAAALAANGESRMDAIAQRIYAPIAAKHGTTPQNVERLIRHAVESTMDTIGAEEIYAFFGNTIDPTRGKPTNAQMIAMLAQRVRGSDAILKRNDRR